MVKKKVDSFSTIEDLRSLLDKRGRLPEKIIKLSVCKDVVKLLGSNVVHAQKNKVNLKQMLL